MGLTNRPHFTTWPTLDVQRVTWDVMVESGICSCDRSQSQGAYVHAKGKRNVREGCNWGLTWFSKRFC